MTLAPGTRVGAYEILSAIGQGGMGEVWRARDIKLSREVALKTLPEGLAADPDRLSRLQREARLLASLSHPNIAAIYGLEEASGVRALILELVEGSTLRDRVSRGPMPVDEALAIARQVAAALEAAHDRGILHRDLKPANIKVRQDGMVKVLDFGLAKAIASDPFHQEDQPTVTMDATREGAVLGTAAYMSPEQARGQPLDSQADIWAFGCVVYELLTGRAAFGRATMADTLSAVLEREPEWDALPPDTPRSLRRILQRSLAKDSRERLRDIHDIRVELDELQSARDASRRAPRAGTSPGRRWTWPMLAMTALALTALAGTAVWLWRTEASPSARETMQEAASPITVAVLPLSSVAGENVDFLAVGIPDGITRLSNVRRFRVRPSSAVVPFLGQEIDVEEIGRELRAQYVLVGTIRATADRVRVSVQLVDTNDGSPVWGRQYDRARGDLLGVEDAVAGEIATALQVQMSEAERERFYQRYTSNNAAYERYLMGRARLRSVTEEGALQALAEFEAARDLDPAYALAYAGIASAAAQMRIRFAPGRGSELWDARARHEADRALELDPGLAEAHEALAAVYRYQGLDWDAVVRESRRALELNASLDTPHIYLAVAYFHIGLLDEAAREVEMARDLNPGNRLEAAETLAAVHVWAGRMEEAIRELSQTRDVSDSRVARYLLGLAHYYDGDAERAEALLETMIDEEGPLPSNARAALAALQAARGERAGAQRLADRVAEESDLNHHAAYGLGVAYAQLGDPSAALRWLSQAATTGFPCYPWYERDPLLDPIRTDSRFAEFMRGLGRSWEDSRTKYASGSDGAHRPAETGAVLAAVEVEGGPVALARDGAGFDQDLWAETTS
jgi:TolB-like protein